MPAAKTRLILASGSPQRKRILKMLGMPFRAIASHVSEKTGRLKNPTAIAKHLAFLKAEAVSKKYPNHWVLGVDTLVVLSNGKISGKPKNKAEAIATLKMYQNSYCDVISGIALINHAQNRTSVRIEKARLYFRDFSDQDIHAYLKSTTRWKGSSGSMTIEGIGPPQADWVKKLKGDYWNVVGLPIVTLKKMLKSF